MKFYDTATSLALVMLASTIYHFCDNNRNYKNAINELRRANLNILNQKIQNSEIEYSQDERRSMYNQAMEVDESEFHYYCLYRHSLLMFMDFYMAAMAIVYCSFIFTKIEGQTKTTILLISHFIITVTTLNDKKGANMWIVSGGIGFLIAAWPKFTRFTMAMGKNKNADCATLAIFLTSWKEIIISIVLLIFDGIIKGVLQTDLNYDFTHGIEHCVWAGAFYYFLKCRENMCEDVRRKNYFESKIEGNP